MSLHEMTAREQAAAIARRDLSPVELLDHYLARIDEHSLLGAYLTLAPELARHQARAAEQAVLVGQGLSPLLGVPVPIKDLVNVKGVRCTYGSAVFAERVAHTDDPLAGRLAQAGTVMIGKTNTPEFALPCYTENAIAPPTRNPWRPTLSPGGSSGGSAAAVAAGLAPVAHGTDAGGSVRIPASACGLVGIKPTTGLISDIADPLGISTHGALARTVDDAAALIDTMSERWRTGDGLLTAPSPDGPLRCAVIDGSLVPGAAVEGSCRAACDITAARLRDLGHHVEEIDLTFDETVVEAFSIVLAAAAARAPVPDERPLMPFTRFLRERAAQSSEAQLHAAQQTFSEVSARMRTVFEDVDVILTPTLATLPGPIGTLRDDAPETEFAKMAGFMPFTPLANITGGPSISIPALHADGIPVGAMLSAARHRDDLLVSLGRQLESVTGWPTRPAPSSAPN